MSFLFSAHSGLRYLVLLAAVAAIVMLAYSVATGRSIRPSRILANSFAGLLDLQIVLGIGLVMGGIYTDAVTGHLMLMLLAAIVTHAAFVVGQQMSNDRRELAVRLGGIVLALIVIAAGIVAIGQSILGSSALR
jgi:heme A synthase